LNTQFIKIKMSFRILIINMNNVIIIAKMLTLYCLYILQQENVMERCFMAAVIIGALPGICQYFLLREIALRLTGTKSGSIIPFFIAKIAVYAVCAAIMLLMRDYILQLGIGFAGGILISSFAGFIHEIYRGNKR